MKPFHRTNFLYSNQALTNEPRSTVRSCTPVLQHFFVNVLPYQDILYVLTKQNISYTLFRKHNVYLGKPQYGYGLSNLSLILSLQYALKVEST